MNRIDFVYRINFKNKTKKETKKKSTNFFLSAVGLQML